MTLTLWLGFFLAAILIAVTPGPGAVLSMSVGVRHGYIPALRAILGLQVAILTHLVIVALGLGVILAASETAFAITKLLGAAYLVWLGVQKWCAPTVSDPAIMVVLRRENLFVQGLLVNLTNPKAIIFIGALVPQFIDATQPIFIQYLIVAATLCATDIFVMSAYALAAVKIAHKLYQPASAQLQNRIFGGFFVLAGIFLANASRPG